MTIGELAVLTAPGLLSSMAVFFMRGAIGSNRSLGERVGALEKRADYAEGYKVGFREGYEQAKAEHGTPR